VEVYAALLPGRESAFQLAPIRRWDTLLESLVPHLLTRLDQPYCVLGHSLGAVIALEVLHELVRRGARPPARLFVMASIPPHLPRPQPQIAGLPDDEFIDGVRRYGGIPEMVLQSREIMELALPALRADFALSESFERKARLPLPCPITALGGDEDSISQADLRAWREHSTGSFRLQMFEGGHFFPFPDRSDVLRFLAHEIDDEMSHLPQTEGTDR
jgi:medium-chain acyl-[acyl-carrier-protein] hydrolase